LAFEYAISAKWLELLKEIAPAVKRVAVLRDATSAAGIGQFAAIQSVASSLGVQLTPIGVNDSSEIERRMAGLARAPDNGLVVTQSGPAIRQRKLIIALAARYRLPAVFSLRQDVVSGALISYGPDSVEPYRHAAGYIDRILKGEKPADLPVQAPTKHELVINLKTAKALGLAVPPMLLARADEVIE
jgi:putative ABC transport system substrate-binding protein